MPIFIIFVDWEHILDRWGWPTLILIAVSFIVWRISQKIIWPKVDQYLEDARNDRLEAQKVLRIRADNLEKREETQLAGFVEALDGLKEVLNANVVRQEAQAKMMEETLKLVKDTNDIVRKRR